MLQNKKIAAVIPTFRVLAQIEKVLVRIPNYFVIYVVDDKCDQGSGQFVQEHLIDPRIKVIFQGKNKYLKKPRSTFRGFLILILRKNPFSIFGRDTVDF